MAGLANRRALRNPGAPSDHRGPRSRRFTAALAAAALTAGVAGPAARAASAPHPATAPASVFTWHLAQLDDPAATPDVPDPIGNSSAAIQSEIDAYNAKAQAMQTQSTNLANDANSLTQRESDLENQSNQITSQESDLDSQATSLESQITDLNNEITAHNAEPHEFTLPEEEAEYEAYNAEADALNSRRAALQSQASSVQSKVTNLQNSETAIQAKQTQLQTDEQTHNDAVTALQDQAAELDGERQKILSDVASAEQQAAQPQEGAPFEDTPGGDAADPAEPGEAGADQGPPDTVQSEPAVSGGDSAEPGGTYEPTGSGKSGSASAPPETVTETPVRATLSPDAVRSLPPEEAAHLDPTTTYDGLIPEADGDYALTEEEPPAGQSLPPGQKAFDDAIGKGGKATTEINGEPVTIDKVDPVEETPPEDAGGDTPRPTPRTPGATEPAAPGPAVSLNQLQDDMNELGLGDEASKFDLEYSKTLTDADGEPEYGDEPRDASGNPELGPDGKPILRFSDLGLRDPATAEETFADDDLEYEEDGLDPCLEHSFAGDTRVLMANGGTEPIAAVKAGDRIENAQPGGGNEVHGVDQVHVTTTDARFVDVVLGTPSGVQTVTSTANHPYYDLSTAAFVNAGALLPGDRLQSGTGASVVVRSVQAHIGPMVTYDLTIDGLHTYYVIAGNTPVLVHNVGECPADPTVKHGKLGEMAEVAEMKKEGYTDIETEVQFKNSQGKVFRADVVGRNPVTGDWEAAEVKTGAGAKLTPNQLVGYPELQNSGARLYTSKLSRFGLNNGDFVKMPVRLAPWECPICGSVVP